MMRLMHWRQNMSKPKAEIKTITPELAKEWLANRFERTREIQPKHVALLAEQIREGKWEKGMSTIVLGTDGKLLDGAHRLSAVIEMGMPIESIVVQIDAVPDAEELKRKHGGRTLSALIEEAKKQV
jgi:hypothetical protein